MNTAPAIEPKDMRAIQGLGVVDIPAVVRTWRAWTGGQFPGSLVDGREAVRGAEPTVPQQVEAARPGVLEGADLSKPDPKK